MTEHRALEERLQQAQKMEAIGTLAGGIAHDFNNMLAVIIGNAELVLDDLDDNGDSRRSVEQILKASQRSRDLVKQILTFSAKSERKKVPLRLTSIVQETIELLRGSLPNSILIELNSETDEDSILGNRSQLQQVLMNLASNAAHAMRDEGGTLTVRLSHAVFKKGQPPRANGMQQGRYVKLTVSDTGPGIPPAARERIFEPFFTTKEAGEGTGMGLAVVYGIVKGHDGAITVDSKIGKGTTFTLFFPACSAEEEEDRKEAPPPTGRERILLIDDEPFLVETVAKILEHLGYQVTAAQSAREGWKRFEENKAAFDLVITDQVMPDISGIKLAEKMLALRKDLPVILFTGYSDTASPEKAEAAGIDHFLLKPVERNELARTVRRALDRKKR